MGRSVRSWVRLGALTSLAVASAGVALVSYTASAAEPTSQPTPPDSQLVGTFTMIAGTQAYHCVAGSWAFIAPQALLTDAVETMNYGVSVDGSGVTWQLVDSAGEVSAPDVGTVDQTVFKVESALGKLAGVTEVRQVNATGGGPPAGSCTEPAQVQQSYSATYEFWAAAPAQR